MSTLLVAAPAPHRSSQRGARGAYRAQRAAPGALSVRRVARRGGRAASEESGGSDSEGFFDALGVAGTDESPPEHIIVPATAFYDAGAPSPGGAAALVPCMSRRTLAMLRHPAAGRLPQCPALLPAQSRRRSGNYTSRPARQRASAARAFSSALNP